MTASSKELTAHRKSSIHARFDEKIQYTLSDFVAKISLINGRVDHPSLQDAQQARWQSVSASAARLNPKWSFGDYCIARADQD